MSVFAHKNDKSKFDLGNEADLTGIGDGTPFGAIKEINNNLTDFSFAVNNGVPQFSVDGGTTWNDLGGGGMPTIDWGNPIYTFTNNTDTEQTYTAVKECYLIGTYATKTINSPQALYINNIPVTYAISGTNDCVANDIFFKLRVGDTVRIPTLRDYGILHIYEKI